MMASSVFNIGTLSISGMDKAEMDVLHACSFLVNSKYHEYIGWFKKLDSPSIDFLVTQDDILKSGSTLQMEDFYAAGIRLTGYKVNCFGVPQLPLVEVIEKVARGKGIRIKFSWEVMDCFYKN